MSPTRKPKTYRRKILDEIISILTETFRCQHPFDVSEKTSLSDFIRDDGDWLEFMQEIEDAFEISITEGELNGCRTVGGVVGYILKQVPESAVESDKIGDCASDGTPQAVADDNAPATINVSNSVSRG